MPLINTQNKTFSLIENYIYIYQLDKYVILPVFPEQVNDSLGSTFQPTNILARTAPIYSYSYSGPRRVQLTLSLHRDLMNDVNYSNTTFLNTVNIEDDYIDTLLKYLQAMGLPKYSANNTTSRMINPPQIAVRLGNTLFIKGIVAGDIGVTYKGAIDRNNKYQEVDVTFNVEEVEPQDAESILKWGSFRGLETVLTRNMTPS